MGQSNVLSAHRRIGTDEWGNDMFRLSGREFGCLSALPTTRRLDSLEGKESYLLSHEGHLIVIVRYQEPDTGAWVFAAKHGATTCESCFQWLTKIATWRLRPI